MSQAMLRLISELAAARFSATFSYPPAADHSLSEFAVLVYAVAGRPAVRQTLNVVFAASERHVAAHWRQEFGLLLWIVAGLAVIVIVITSLILYKRLRSRTSKPNPPS